MTQDDSKTVDLNDRRVDFPVTERERAVGRAALEGPC